MALKNYPDLPGSSAASATLKQQLTGLSEYANDSRLRDLLYGVMPDAFTKELRQSHRDKLVSLLLYVYLRGLEVGVEKANWHHNAKQAGEIDSLAATRAKQALQWLLDNFDNLEISE